MATEFSQGSQGASLLTGVLLSDPEATLKSIVFASREGLATVHAVADAFPQQAVKLAINYAVFGPGDFIVRSVVAGARRKFEVLACADAATGIRLLLSRLPADEVRYHDARTIEFTDGHSLMPLPEAITLATFRGR